MQYEKVKGFLEDARKNGNVIAGGAAMDRPGYFIEPTIVRDIKEGSQAGRRRAVRPGFAGDQIFRQ